MTLNLDVVKWASSQQPREQPAVAEPATTLPADQSTPHPEVASVPEPSVATKKTPGPSARKRKVSFSDAAATPDKPAERHAQSKTVTGTPLSSAKTAETPATPKPVGPEEPPKKRSKKEVKAKDVQPAEGIESPLAKTSRTTKPRVKKSAALDHGNEVGVFVADGCIRSCWIVL